MHILRRVRSWAPVLASVAALGCGDDDAGATEFLVEIENVSGEADLTYGGAFDTPVGMAAPAPIGPGESYQVEFAAGPGARLSFATMFVHSNDYFYAPGPEGIALFDTMGDPVVGDVTGEIVLWDAGAEEDQEPGVGDQQPPSQGAPNTGDADDDTTVRPATDGFGNLPAVADVIEVTLVADSLNHFTLTITNVSTATTLTRSTGGATSVPLAPGVFAVHHAGEPLFTAGAMASGVGLEALAEDGDPSALAASLMARVGLPGPLVPGVWVLHEAACPSSTGTHRARATSPPTSCSGTVAPRSTRRPEPVHTRPRDSPGRTRERPRASPSRRSTTATCIPRSTRWCASL